MDSVSSYRPLLTQRQYLKLVAAGVVNRFGDSIDAIAFSWLMYEITQSAALMAFILGLNYLPTILLQPFTGALVEHLPKKRVMIACDVGRGLVVTLGVAFYLNGFLTPALLAGMTLLISTLEAFSSPASAAIVPKLLAPELYTVGTALSRSANRVAELIGLVLAGGVVALLGCEGALLIDVGTFFLSALLISLIKLSETLERSRANLRAAWVSLKEGFMLIHSQRIFIALLPIGALINFTLIPVNAFAVPFIADYLHGGAELLAILNILLVAGMAAGSAIAPKIPRMGGRAKLVYSGLLQGAAICLFALGAYLPGDALRYGVVLAAGVLLGFGAGVIGVVFGAAFLHLVPADFMARLSGLSNAILCCSLPVGNFLCSALASVLPVPGAFLVAGLLSFVLYTAILKVKSLEAL